MAANEYLRGVLAKYAVDTGPLSPLRTLANTTIYPAIQQWAGQYLQEVSFSGSFAKGTANNCSNDLDLFISLKPATPETLGEIYSKLIQHTTPLGWAPRPQDVSVGVTIGNCHVDLVPGRIQQGYQNWHSLYRHRKDSWTQTNIQIHINHTINSGRVEEIRLVKLWRHLANIDFPSFFLEMAVIEALSGRQRGNLADNFSYALQWIGSSLPTAFLVDPANTNNTVSNDLTVAQKQTIAQAARTARAQPKYENFVW